MHTIPCQPCEGTGKVTYSNNQEKDCLICQGLGTIQITNEEYEKLQALEGE